MKTITLLFFLHPIKKPTNISVNQKKSLIYKKWKNLHNTKVHSEEPAMINRNKLKK